MKVVALVLVLSSLAFCQITLGVHNSVAGCSITSPAVDTTGNTLAVVGVSGVFNSTMGPPMDTPPGNTYSSLTSFASSGLVSGVQLWYHLFPTTDASMQWFYTTGCSFGSPAAITFNATVTSGSPVRGSVVNATTSGAQTSLATGAIAYTAGDVIVCALDIDIGGPSVIGSGSGQLHMSNGFTVDELQGPGGSFGVAIAHLITTSGSSVTTTWDWTGGTATTVASSCAAFKAPGGSARVPIRVTMK